MKCFRSLLLIIALLIPTLSFGLAGGETQLYSTIWFRYFSKYSFDTTENKNKFEPGRFYIGRCYVGLKHSFGDKFEAHIRVNILGPEGERLELRVAEAIYKPYPSLSLEAGVMVVPFSISRFWDYRIIPVFPEGERQYGGSALMPAADFGILSTWNVTGSLTLRCGVFNGEGFSVSHNDADKYPSLIADLIFAPPSGIYFLGSGFKFEKREVTDGATVSTENRILIAPYFGFKKGFLETMLQVDLHKVGDLKQLAGMSAFFFHPTSKLEPVLRLDWWDPNLDIKRDEEIDLLTGLNYYLYKPNPDKFSPNVFIQLQYQYTKFRDGSHPTQDIMLQLHTNLETAIF